MNSIACFISSHGFGHATRISAILDSLARHTDIKAQLFTAVSESVFHQCIAPYNHHHQITDVGFVQHDAFRVDINATIEELDQFLPFTIKRVKELANQCRGCSLILCDISALGIAVAEYAQIPSILVENFTWDWLYEPYILSNPRLGRFSDYLKNLYAKAAYHVQTSPCCSPAMADLHCGPIFRGTREAPNTVRSRLKIDEQKLVLITLGGIGFTPSFFDKLTEHEDFYFIVTGQKKSESAGKNVLLLDNLSNYYHPDLINCADLVVFKAGYSTLAECFQSGKPSICIAREGFAESRVLETFARQVMLSEIISQNDFISGKWLSLLNKHPQPRVKPIITNGADEIRDFILPLLT